MSDSESPEPVDGAGAGEQAEGAVADAAEGAGDSEQAEGEPTQQVQLQQPEPESQPQQAEPPQPQQSELPPQQPEPEPQPQQAESQPQPQLQPQMPYQPPYPDGGYQNYPPPGTYPPPPGTYPPPPGTYPPPPGSYPPPGTYPVGAPARLSGPPIIALADLLPAALDGLVALAAALVTAVIALVLVIYVGFSGVHLAFGLGDVFAMSCWLTASSLGAPITDSTSQSVSLGSAGIGDSTFSVSSAETIRITVWLLTIIVLFLSYRAARRRERAVASHSLGQLTLRAALPAVVVSIVLLILALTSQRSAPFSDTSITLGQTGNNYGGTDTPFVFLGPLLLVFAAALLGRIGVWSAASTADPRAARVRTQFALWRPSLRLAWLQVRIIGVLSGVGLWIYAAVESVNDQSTSSHSLAFVLGALFLIPNLAIYGTFAGFGVTLYASAATAGFSGLSGSGSPGVVDDTNPGGGFGIGIFGNDRPWGVWLLLLAVVVGTAVPAVLARRSARFAVQREDYAPAGAWRSALVGLVAALAIVLLGAMEISGSISEGSGVGSFASTDSFGPSLLAALGLTALWFLLAYLTLSLSLGHRIQVVSRLPQPAAPYGGYGPIPGQQGGLDPNQQATYQQYLQQYPQAYQQPYPGESLATEPLATEPLATEPLASQPPAPEQSASEPTQFVGTFGSVPATLPNSTVEIPAEQEQRTEPTKELPQQYQQQAQRQYQPPYAQPYPQPYAQQYAQWPAPGQPGQPGQPGAPRTGRRLDLRPKVVIPIVVVVLLAVSGFLAYHFASGTSLSGPDAAVSSYFQDLQSGDAKSAAALATGPYPGTPLVSAATLANAADRPSGLVIVSTKAASTTDVSQMQSYGVTGHNFTYVSVKYSIHGAVLADTFLAEQNTQTSKWLLFDPYEQLSVTGGWSSTMTVDGVSVAESQDVEVFPAGHVVAEPSSPDFAPVSTTVYPTDGSSGLQTVTSTDPAYGEFASIAQITLPNATLSAAGQQAAQTAYSTALSQCATEADTGYGVCGLDDTYNGYTCNSVTWTITHAAAVQVDTTSGSDGSYNISASGSTASESGDYTDYLTNADVTFSNQSTTLEDSNGTIMFNADGSATVDLSG